MKIADNPAFWRMMDELIASHEIVIDRPKASRHPNHSEYTYPVDYGYLAGTSSMDGEGIDLWRGTAADQKLTAMFVTVDPAKKDSEIKLLIGCTDEEIALIDHFFNGYDTMKGLLVFRENDL